MDVVVPVPVVVPPGLLVKIQVPIEGNPFMTILPVSTTHVGCVIVPISGVGGVTGLASITTFSDAGDVHSIKLVDVKVKDPGVINEIVVLVPEST